ncbi:MAG: ATP synthase F0 subunit B [Thermotogae bacterium]|nr:MAG: ATP synthase F0 subunit B [Thermotogota bacterium]
MGLVELNLTGLIQLLNFLVLLFVLYKLLYKPFMQILDQRREKIHSEILEVEKLRKDAEDLKKEAKEQLKQSQQRASEIIDEALRRKEEIIAQAVEKSKVEAERIINNAKAQVDREMKQALEEVEKHAGELAIVLATKLLKGILDEKAKKEYLKRYLEKETAK